MLYHVIYAYLEEVFVFISCQLMMYNLVHEWIINGYLYILCLLKKNWPYFFSHDVLFSMLLYVTF
jgi:hypothetical protein